MPPIETSSDALRSRAEALLPEPAAQFGPSAAPQDLNTLLRELRLHEIELELQNASLRDSHVELEQSRAKLRELYDCVPTAHFSLAEDCTILDANDAAFALLASTREAAVGRRISRWINADDFVAFTKHRRELAVAGSSVTSYLTLDIGDARREVRLDSVRARDGSSESLATITDLGDGHRSNPTLEASALTSTILDAAGLDVTSVKARQAQVVVAERLAAVGQLAAGVGHEINNPLAYVKSSLELASVLLNRLPEERPKLERMIDVAQEGAERIRLIVEDLRVLSSHDVRSVDAIDVRELLSSCAKLGSNEIGDRARLVVDYRHVPRVMANAGRLSQVFLNLLVNAARSIGKGHGGSDEIGLCTHTAADGGVVVEIRDTGSGIAGKDLAHIFEPFFITERMGEGTGLGLAICHGIITQLGGRISVESESGHGTTFRIWLPAATSVPAKLSAQR